MTTWSRTLVIGMVLVAPSLGGCGRAVPPSVPPSASDSAHKLRTEAREGTSGDEENSLPASHRCLTTLTRMHALQRAYEACAGPPPGFEGAAWLYSFEWRGCVAWAVERDCPQAALGTRANDPARASVEGSEAVEAQEFLEVVRLWALTPALVRGGITPPVP